MAGKQAKIRMKTKAKPEISGPLTFEHVHHVDPGKSWDGGGGGSTNGSCPASPGRMSSEYGKDFFNLHLSEELKYLIRSEISTVIKEELAPYKRCLELLAREKSDTLLVRPIPESADNARVASSESVEHDDDLEDKPVYVNSNAMRQGPRLKRSSLSNPIYDVSLDDYIDSTLPGLHFINGQSSVSSETAPKKPMPSPRPHASRHRGDSAVAAEVTSTDIDNQSVRHVSPCKSFSRSLSNPAINTTRVPFRDMSRAESVSVQPSMSSETHVKLPHPCPGPNTLPRGCVAVLDRRPSEPIHPKKGERGADKRQCLANALQTNIEDIVDNVIFTESELPDALAADSCITDEESSDIRKLPNKKDQIRVLISTIKGRDLVVLQRFLRQIETTNKEVADKVKATFEDNVRNGVRESLCACCEMKNNVNIKYVVDGLWSIRAISDGLFTEIARYESSTGEQCVLWVRLMDSLNSNPKKEMKKKAYRRLVQDLSRKNHYNYIAEAIDAFLIRYQHLGCKCKVHFRVVNDFRYLTGVSSCSPWSSTSDVRHCNDMLSVSARSSDQEGEAAPDATGPGQPQAWPGHSWGSDRFSVSARSIDQEDRAAKDATGPGQPRAWPGHSRGSDRFSVSARSSSLEAGTTRSGDQEAGTAPEATGPGQSLVFPGQPHAIKPPVARGKTDTEIAIEPIQDKPPPSVPPRTRADTESAIEPTTDTPGLTAQTDTEPAKYATALTVPPRPRRRLQRQNATKASDFDISSK